MLSDKDCEKILKTYNMNILNNFSLQTQAVIYSIVDKIREKKPVLARLIQNHYKGQKPVCAFLEGPERVMLLKSNKHNKIIYIFGEVHSDYFNCANNPVYETYSRKQKTLTELQGSCYAGQLYDEKNKICVPVSSKEGQDLINENKKYTTGNIFGVMGMDVYLEQLTQNTDVFLDIFIEHAKYTGEEYKGNPFDTGIMLDKIGRSFKDCIEYSNRGQEKCQLFRMHYVDVRSLDEKYGMASRLAGWYDYDVVTIANMVSNDKEIYNLIIDMNNAVDTKEKYIQFWTDFYRKDISGSTEKELLRSTLPREIIENYTLKVILERAEPQYEVIKGTLDTLLNWSHEPELYLGHARFFARFFIWVTAPVIDSYTIARMFKRFNLTKQYAKEANIDQPEEPSNIIMYAGEFHTSNCIRFLTDVLDFEVVRNTHESIETHGYTETCLNMIDFPQPLFTSVTE